MWSEEVFQQNNMLCIQLKCHETSQGYIHGVFHKITCYAYSSKAILVRAILIECYVPSVNDVLPTGEAATNFEVWSQ